MRPLYAWWLLTPTNRTGGLAIDFNTFLVTVFCLVADWLKGQRLRQRGPAPTLHDSEVLTMEILGEFLGIDTDDGLYCFFRRYYGEWFPALKRVDRTTFTRQAANLWVAKTHLWRHVLGQVQCDPQISLLDSFPVPVCRFARAYRCRTWAGIAAYGRDEVANQTFYGLRAHLRVVWPGVIAEAELAAANQHELQVALDLLDEVTGWALGTATTGVRTCGSIWQVRVCSCWRPTNPPNASECPDPVGWCRRGDGLKRSLDNSPNVIMPRKCGRGMPGTCARAGCANC